MNTIALAKMYVDGGKTKIKYEGSVGNLLHLAQLLFQDLALDQNIPATVRMKLNQIAMELDLMVMAPDKEQTDEEFTNEVEALLKKLDEV